MFALMIAICCGSASMIKAKDDVLAGLDSFGQNPLDKFMQEMRDEMRAVAYPIVEKIREVLTKEEGQLILDWILQEKRMEELLRNPNFGKQEAILAKLSQEFEKKGMTEENSKIFAERAQKECPLAFEYTALATQVGPLKEVVSALFIELFSKSLEK